MSLERRRELRGEAYNVAIRKLKELNPLPWMPVDSVYIEDTDINKIRSLVNQHQYGIAAQDELLDACIAMGWMNP